MDGRSDRGMSGAHDGRWRVARTGVSTGLTFCALGLLAGPAVASPIRSHHLIVVNNAQSLGPAWARFLAGGVSLWEIARPPRFPSGLVLPTNSKGTLVDTPFVEYLHWRRSLDPARFDLVHPNIATELGQFVPPTAGGTSTGGGTKPFNPAPQNLPEPATLPIAIVLGGAGLAWRRRIAGQPGRLDR